MKFKIQVVAVSDDGREQTREIASLERDDLQPETLGLTLAESKAILKGLQEIVVQRQATDLLLRSVAVLFAGERENSRVITHSNCGRSSVNSK